MTPERWKALMKSDHEPLTPEEIEAGWHFCDAFDGLLVGPGMGELANCTCHDGNHSVYTTIPQQKFDSEDGF